MNCLTTAAWQIPTLTSRANVFRPAFQSPSIPRMTTRRRSKMSKFYAVKVGREKGIYSTWAEAVKQVNGFPGAVFKSFKTQEDAQQYLDGTALVPLRLPGSPPRKKARQDETKKDEQKDDEEACSSAAAAAAVQMVKIYTDGACPSNGSGAHVAGCGVYFGRDDDPRNISEKLPSKFSPPTNNAAELYAIQLALESFLRGTNFARPSVSTGKEEWDTVLTIYSDSTYAINCITKWARGWSKKGWKTTKGEDVKNVPIIQSILALLDNEVPSHIRVEFTWVKGHAKIVGNEKADALANKACGVMVV